ncbi:hypothetical protein BZG36_02016 [Bifiguratus adelaidae]|uniref:N-acetyltransferase domain-containing protein n=1 Tax=Bifiguratus adelaidae TaxID=1938954 RepID=A0A261Y428_9FUNG|nr:hypothetical protein BZG36_02016 [Bifiguratus adelaidae]
MAAFGTFSLDWRAFQERWTKLLADPTVIIRTVTSERGILGHVLIYVDDDPELDAPRTELSYWIDRAWWGRGVATQAMRQFLAEIQAKPIWGQCAADNCGSRRVLEKCGFSLVGTERSFATARGGEIEESIYRLN